MSEMQPNAKGQFGFSLVELLVASGTLVILSTMISRFVTDLSLTSKTLSISADANTEMLRMLRNIRMTFQESLPESSSGGVRRNRERGCVLKQSGGTPGNPKISDFSCESVSVGQSGLTVKSAGIGFELDDNIPPKPGVAFVNACEPIPAGMTYPLGRAKLNVPPADLGQLQGWGTLNKVCPSACASNQRPVVKLLRKDGEKSISISQYPRRITGPTDSPALYLWGAVICASQFSDEVRQFQELYGDNVGGYLPNYLNISVFVARGQFDVKSSAGKSMYVWAHGGDLLEFNASQELVTFKCKPGQAGCGAE